ncbi:hypothetical protein JRQ81_016706, partial [Phrynocephalus forsythii]
VKAVQQLYENEEELGLAEQVLIPDMPTRWNSTFETPACLVEQKDMLVSMISTRPILPWGRELDISAINWLTLTQVVEILKPFEGTTKVLGGCTTWHDSVILASRDLRLTALRILKDGSHSCPF